MKNLFAAMISLAGELGLPLNLGGGVEPGDSLETFKQGFANATAPVPHPRDGLRPGGLRGAGRGAKAAEGFFPAYRASRAS